MITSQVKFRTPSHWLFSKERAGGGILSWLGCHYLDMLAYLLEDEVESVSAEIATLSGEAIDVEDVATVSMRFRRGTLATLTAGYLLATSVKGYSGAAYSTHIALYGPQGRVEWSPWDSNSLTVESVSPEWASAPRRQIAVDLPESPAYGGVHGEEFVRRFLRASEGDGDSPAGLDAGLHVLRLLDAIYRSAADGARAYLADK